MTAGRWLRGSALNAMVSSAPVRTPSSSSVTAATATQWNFSMGGIGLPSYPRNHIPDFEGEVFTWGPHGAIVDHRSLPSGRMNGDLHNS